MHRPMLSCGVRSLAAVVSVKMRTTISEGRRSLFPSGQPAERRLHDAIVADQQCLVTNKIRLRGGTSQVMCFLHQARIAHGFHPHTAVQPAESAETSKKRNRTGAGSCPGSVSANKPTCPV